MYMYHILSLHLLIDTKVAFISWLFWTMLLYHSFLISIILIWPMDCTEMCVFILNICLSYIFIIVYNFKSSSQTTCSIEYWCYEICWSTLLLNMWSVVINTPSLCVKEVYSSVSEYRFLIFTSFWFLKTWLIN